MRNRWVRGRTLGVVVAAVVVVVAAAVAVLLFGGAGDDAAHEPALPPPTAEVEIDGLRFVYHRTTGVASLFDLRADPQALRNVIRERPDDARRLERELLKKEGVKDLQELQREYEEVRRQLAELGYI